MPAPDHRSPHVLAAVSSAVEVAAVVCAVPAAGPLPSRMLVVPNVRYLHAVRKSLLLGGRVDALAGLSAVRTVDLAARVLVAAGVAFRDGEEDVRAARIELALRRGHVPEGFDREAILRARGWDVAFARVIGELEEAGLRPADLAAIGEARARGVAALWAHLDAEAGDRLTRARIVLQSVALAESGRGVSHPGPLPPDPIVAVVTADTPAVELRLLAALPGVQLVVQRAQPLDDSTLRRFDTHLGPEAAAALRSPPSAGGTTALARLRRSTPARTADATHSARSRGGAIDSSTTPSARAPLDPSLRFELHAGVDREVDAAARWVAEQIEAGVALEDIAVLAAERDPYPELLYERIRSLGDDAPLAVHVAGGLPLGAVAGGARVLSVLRAIDERLGAASMWTLLPLLRLAPSGDPGARRFLSSTDAFEIAFGLGTGGGHPVAPDRARQWPDRARAAIARLAAELEADADDPRAQLDARGKARMLAHLQRLLPALQALDTVMAATLDRRSLSEITARLFTFFTAHVGRGARSAAQLLFSALEGREVPEGVDGAVAIEHLLDVARRVRVPTCRFGEPAVFVGTLGHAAGLSFAAVRIVGLAEGTVPPRVRPDVILGEDARRTLGLPSRGERAAAVRRRYDAAIASARDRLVLSCPRVALDRATRAPSPVLTEAIAAVTGADDPLAALDAAFRTERTAAQARIRDRPLRPSERLDRVASTLRHPAGWDRGAPIGPLDRTDAGEDDAIEAGLGDPRWTSAPGLHPDTPISASALGKLLSCPHRFFAMRVLSWDEALAEPDPGSLPIMTFGTAIHTCAERFFTAHGDAFEARRGSLPEYVAHAHAIVDEVFAELREVHVLAHDEAWTTEVDRAREHMRALLDHEWDRDPGRLVAMERPFGLAPEPAVRLETPQGPLWVRGAIDRMRVAGTKQRARLEVWDIKSGKNKGTVRASTAPDPNIDLQIGVYMLVAAERREAWTLPAQASAGYVYTDHAKGPERCFGVDRAEDLAEATRTWLGVARGLLAGGLYPRTPDEEDCTYCHLRRACGPAATLRSARLLRKARGPLRAFAELKGIEVDEEGADA